MKSAGNWGKIFFFKKSVNFKQFLTSRIPVVVITWSNNAWVLDCFATANCSSVSAVVTLMLIGGFGILSWHWFLNECCKSFLSVYCLIGEASLIYNMIKNYEVFNTYNLIGADLWVQVAGCTNKISSTVMLFYRSNLLLLFILFYSRICSNHKRYQ